MLETRDYNTTREIAYSVQRARKIACSVQRSAGGRAEMTGKIAFSGQER